MGYVRSATLWTKEGESVRRGEEFLKFKGSMLPACSGLFASTDKSFPVAELCAELPRDDLSS